MADKREKTPSNDESDSGTDQPAGDMPDSDAAPTLNRAERRAQAQGKKTAPGSAGGSGFQKGANGFSGRQGAGVNKGRIPRTGHK